MHEYAVVISLLDAVETQARELGAQRVAAINLVIGERSCIVEDSLRFYVEMLAPGTLVDGAELNIRRTAMRFYCAACDRDYSPTGADFRCPQCREIGQLADDGSRMVIESMEIEA